MNYIDVNPRNTKAPGEFLTLGISGSGKSFATSHIFSKILKKSNSAITIIDPKTEIGYSDTLNRYLSMTPNERRSEYATNNWRRLHGYPLRRGAANKMRKNYSIEKFWWQYFENREKAGFVISLIDSP